MDDSFGKRLQTARKQAGFKTADEAIERFGWSKHTYKAHEGGSRTPKDAAKKYAKAYKVRQEWLLLNSGEMLNGQEREEKIAVGENSNRSSYQRTVHSMTATEEAAEIFTQIVTASPDTRKQLLQWLRGGALDETGIECASRGKTAGPKKNN